MAEQSRRASSASRWPVTAVWLRSDVRRRARSLVVLAVLIALSCGTVLAALAGARRGQTAVGRLESRTLPATTAVLANTPGFDWTRVERLPEVEALTRFVVDYDLTTKGVPSEVLNFPPGDAATMRTIEHPVIYSGRLFDARRADEVDVSRRFVSEFHRGIGDHVIIQLPTEAELMSGASSLHGPTIDAAHRRGRRVSLVLGRAGRTRERVPVARCRGAVSGRGPGRPVQGRGSRTSSTLSSAFAAARRPFPSSAATWRARDRKVRPRRVGPARP